MRRKSLPSVDGQVACYLWIQDHFCYDVQAHLYYNETYTAC